MSAQNDAAFLRVFLIVLGALAVFTLSIMIVAGFVSYDLNQKHQQDSRLQAIIAERIMPVGEVEIAKADTVNEAPKPASQIVSEACNACHMSGALGAPKIGDKAVWSDRLAVGGLDGLYHNAINGKGAMPPRGGAASLSDDDIRAAVKHMLEESQVAASMEAGASASTTESASISIAASEIAATTSAKGQDVYSTACLACHMTGAAGAPKLGDKAAWKDRLAQGMATLYANANKGKGAMPPKGGRMDLSDQDIQAAVDYMVEQSK